ncbi:MAG: KPN_02809 family neutral zinc metallopeptidase [Asticcacaulis sp.]
MDWEDGRTSGVEDRRGDGGGFGGSGFGLPHVIGGGGIGAFIIALIAYFVFHISPNSLMSGSGQTSPGGFQPEQAAASTCPAGDQACLFTDTIHTSADDTWEEIFKAQGKPYRRSTMVLYTGGTQTGCGGGDAAMGPFYCPQDERVYLDLDFFNTMSQQLGAPGDFARAYVIAHEVGHHVQNLLGVSDRVTQEMQDNPSRANALSVRLELQADCYAGVWANRSNKEKNWIHPDDIRAGLNAAAAVGDDTLQKETQGRVVPDSFTHGTSAQRMQWFQTGFTTGDPQQCDTFS